MACECAPGFIIEPKDGSCIKCEDGSAPNRWRSKCVPCDNSFKVKKDGVCKCSEDDFEVMQDIAEDGSELDKLKCLSCPGEMYPGLGLSHLGVLTDPNWACKKCEDPLKVYKGDTVRECTCKDGYKPLGKTCIIEADFVELDTEVGDMTAALSVKYKSLLDVAGKPLDKVEAIQSKTMTENFAPSAIGCKKYKRPEDCQTLANLCVLTLYDQTSAPCKFLNKLKKEANPTEAWNQGIPNIEYLRTENFLPKKYLTTSLTDESLGFTLKPEVFRHESKDQLTFYLAQYHLNGTFLGFTELSSQLSICEMTYDDVKVMRRFGTIIISDCSIHMEDLKVGIDGVQKKDANTFFEVFLEDSDGTLIDIPVIVTNWDSGKKSTNEEPNKSFPNVDHDLIQDEWHMVRRFFTIDTISGIKDSKTEPTYVRWAQNLEFKIQMDRTSQSSIFRPYIVVSYQEKDVESISKDTIYPVKFTYEYYCDYASL